MAKRVRGDGVGFADPPAGDLGFNVGRDGEPITEPHRNDGAEAVDTGLEASILEAIEELEVGELSVNMCTRDERVAAL